MPQFPDTTGMRIAYLKSILRYEPETGLFWWLQKRNGVSLSLPAGTKQARGYIVIKIDGKTYRANRLAWFYMTGEWPVYEVDHKNKIFDDNRWENLRDLTRSENMANSPVQVRSKTGVKGVTIHTTSGKYVANIRVNYKLIYLGIFTTMEEAALAYERASIQHFGGAGA